MIKDGQHFAIKLSFNPIKHVLGTSGHISIYSIKELSQVRLQTDNSWLLNETIS